MFPVRGGDSVLLFLFRIFQCGNVESPLPDLRKILLQSLLRKPRRAREDPERILRRAGHNGAGIVRRKLHDPVIPVEGTEEGDAQFPDIRSAFEMCFSDRLPLLSVALSAVDDPDSPVPLLRIVSGNEIQIPFEPMRQTGDLIPRPEIPFGIKVADRCDGIR